MGMMKILQVPGWQYFEWRYKKMLHISLTSKWKDLQSKRDPDTTEWWRGLFRMLELDRKSQRDLWLLAQSGDVGRTYFNYIMWEILSVNAAGPDYADLSHLVTHQVIKKYKTLVNSCFKNVVKFF